MSAGDDRIPPGPADDDAADAWLRAALRHAPDAQVGAPPALSAAILRQAVAATGDAMSDAMSRSAAAGAARRTAGPSLWHRLMTAWAWLAQPPVAAGFASVMLASVVGLMWWDKPLSEALPERAPEATVRPLPPVAPAQAEPELASHRALDSSARAITAAPPATAPADTAAKPLDPSAERRRVAPEAVLGKASPAPRARLVTPVSEPARRESSELLADAAPTPTPVPVPVPAQEQERAPTQAPPPASPAPLAAPAPMAAGAAVPAMRAEAHAKLSAQPREARLLAPPAALLTELRAAIRAEPQRWAWQRGTGAEQPMTAALRAWLDRLGDGNAADTTASESATLMAPTTELRLLRDGRLHTTLSLGAASLRVAPADARHAPQQSALSPAAAAELKTALDAAAP